MVARCSLFSEGHTYRSCTLSQRQSYLYRTLWWPFRGKIALKFWIRNPQNQIQVALHVWNDGWMSVPSCREWQSDFLPLVSQDISLSWPSPPPPQAWLWLVAIHQDCVRIHVDANSHPAIRAHLFKTLILLLSQEEVNQLVHIHSYCLCVCRAIHSYSKSSLNSQWWARECSSVVECFPWMPEALSLVLITVKKKSYITLKTMLLIKKAAKTIASIPGNQCASFQRDLVKTKFAMP